MSGRSIKYKNVAAVLAFFGGFIGLHRYYLGQIGLGIFYTLFALTGITFLIAFIDFIVFISQSKISFDAKYNQEHFYENYGEGLSKKKTGKAGPHKEVQKKSPPVYREIKGANTMFGESSVRSSGSISRSEISALKVKAIRYFRDFDLKESEKIFLRIAEYTPGDASIHFNLACIYSLNEKADKAFTALDKAVKLGMEHLDKISSHDALAYLRIQPEFEAFKRNNFKIPEGGFQESGTIDAFEENEEKIRVELKEEIREERDIDREI